MAGPGTLCKPLRIWQVLRSPPTRGVGGVSNSCLAGVRTRGPSDRVVQSSIEIQQVPAQLEPDVGGLSDPALEVDSVTDIWPGAEWPEREVYDMFGIRFRNHPDLRRILMWKDFPAHPLRKDYPLRGRGERETYRVVHRKDA